MSTAVLSTNGDNHFKYSAPIDTLVVATVNGAVKLTRASGGKWNRTGHSLVGDHVNSLTIDQDNGNLFAALMPGSLMKSTDAGSSWSVVEGPFAGDGMYSLRWRNQNGKSVIYVGTQPVDFFRSEDGGNTWENLSSFKNAPMHEEWKFPSPDHSPHLKTLAIDFRDSNYMLAGVEQGGLLRSTDGGKTWEDMDSWVDYENIVYKDVHQVMMQPSNPDIVYMTTGLGILKSEDRGVNWRWLTAENFRIGYPDQLLFSPGNHQKMFVSGGFAIPYHWVKAKSAKGTIMISDDGGENWRSPKNGYPENRANVEAMTICAYTDGSPYEIFAGNTEGEVVYSNDAGETWSVIASGLAPIGKPTHDTLINGVSYDNGVVLPDFAEN